MTYQELNGISFLVLPVLPKGDLKYYLEFIMGLQLNI